MRVRLALFVATSCHILGHTVAAVDIFSMPRDVTEETELNYPRFPLSSVSDFVWPENLNASEKALSY